MIRLVALMALVFAAHTAHAAGRPVCCTMTDGLTLVNEEYSCSADAGSCCQSHVKAFFPRDRHLVKSNDSSCESVSLDEYRSDVEVCYAPTHIGKTMPVIGTGVDMATNTLHLRHSWIRTPHVEAGQWLSSDNSLWTEWTDHSGNGNLPDSTCYAVAGCDLSCVESNIVIGESLGFYGAFNNCHAVVVRTLSKCGCYDTCLQHNSLFGTCDKWTFPPFGNRDYHWRSAK